MSNGEQKDTIHAAVEIVGPDSGASVDKIRDILFGSQIKNYEARFARLEENLVRETVELKDTMRRRFESLEGFFKSETEALAARLKAEREERSSALHSLEQELKSIHDALGRKIHELDASTAESDSALRKELMAESRKLLEEIDQRHDSLRSLLERRVGRAAPSEDRPRAAVGAVGRDCGTDWRRRPAHRTGRAEIRPRLRAPEDRWNNEQHIQTSRSRGYSGAECQRRRRSPAASCAAC